MKHALSVILLTLIVSLDQVSKAYVLTGPLKNIRINQFLNIVQVWNDGISFGLFSKLNMNTVFIFITGIIALIFAYLLVKSKTTPKAITYSFIVSGALGNLIDRIKYGAVFDFIDIHIKAYHWPAFNVADFFICLGGIMLFWNLIFNKKTWR
jgi:signal peptidase II